ncbi:TMEM165/GDT1 family protein [Erythrobacter crassostreae]|uniref:TMEM165/GDT1 family protein n=1 Tax=Erythrobacter crassostreae TaxID=2828328 RepID=A0A9X1F2D7_9SPHN|nr:TMEM165/GDT1 family protein [Erythrobacter crassostrea]MBV7258078.1 TMEM165/GDT1 family protein [Erythrobacter crassostrea]
MDAFMFTLLLTFIIALGGRDQMIIAQFSDELERTNGLLILGLACAAASAAVMAYAGWTIAAILPARAANMLVAIAIAFAGLELFWRIKLKPMKEPTRSHIAIGVVVLFRQFGDAARFVIFAFAAQAVYPVVTIIGGALGGMAAIAVGWGLGKAKLDRYPLHYIRISIGVCLIVAALFIGLNARFATL